MTRDESSKIQRQLSAACWPRRHGNNLAPWFLIVWRALWMPIIFGGLAIAWLGVLCAFGYHKARHFWADAT